VLCDGRHGRGASGRIARVSGKEAIESHVLRYLELNRASLANELFAH